MDGPNVNWKFLELLQQQQAEQYDGAQLIVVGSCSLHSLHNACKGGFVEWQLDKVLKAMHTLFHNTPARREDFTPLTKITQFPLPFCGHRWLENLPAVERALDVWPSLTTYMDAVTTRTLPTCMTNSCRVSQLVWENHSILVFFLLYSSNIFSSLLYFRIDYYLVLRVQL